MILELREKSSESVGVIKQTNWGNFTQNAELEIAQIVRVSSNYFIMVNINTGKFTSCFIDKRISPMFPNTSENKLSRS